MKKISLIILSLLMLGCYTQSNISFDDEMQAWIGHNRSEIISSWGAPSRTSSDGKNGQILIYSSERYITMSDPYGNLQTIKKENYIQVYTNGNGYIYQIKYKQPASRSQDEEIITGVASVIIILVLIIALMAL